MTVLAINAGSTSIKLALYDLQIQELWAATVSGLGSAMARLRTREGPEVGSSDLGMLDFAAATDRVLQALAHRWPRLSPHAVGHRVVHGGDLGTDAALLDEALMEHVARWSSLAPLHQHLNIAVIEAARHEFPRACHVACFDTGFHRSLPEHARLVALPERLRSLGLRRYGFHGLSFESVLQQLAADGATVRSERVVAAHLGGGSSLCAVRNGRSIETSMGVTPLSGLPMSTRCGDIDAGALLHLLASGELDAPGLQEVLYRQSGLKALSGTSGDMKLLLEAMDSSASARRAVDYYCYHVRCQIGSHAAALEGVDRIVFTGGVGANAPLVRQAICTPLACLGIELDSAANSAGSRTVSSGRSRVTVNVLQTNEEAVIAAKTLAVAAGATPIQGGNENE